MRTIITLAITAILLSACSATAIVASGATGGFVLSDRRTVKTIADDESIAYKINLQIAKDTAFDNSNIVVSSFDRVVLLAGQTPQHSLRKKSASIARSMKGVRRVYNDIKVNTPSSLINRSNDTWITTKIKTQMLTQKGLKSGLIKVITENSTVYLMGEVKPSQAQLAVSVARRVTGVKRVVKVFQYLPE